MLQGGKLIYLKYVCVCVYVCLRVCIYNYPSFLPCKAYRVESTECGNSGTTILSTIEKTMFRPIACACLWSQIENSQPLPPMQKQINTERKKPLSSQHIGPPQLKNEGGCKSSDKPVWTTDSKKKKKLPVLVEEFKNTAEIIRQYRISWLTRATLFISKQYQPRSSVPTTEELREQEDSN